MGVFITKMKTHKREDISKDFLFIHDCNIHKCKPSVWHIVAGKRKESHYIVVCKEDDCGKISMNSADEVVNIWNGFNPIRTTYPLPEDGRGRGRGMIKFGV